MGRVTAGKLTGALLQQRVALVGSDRRRMEPAACVKSYETRYGIKSCFVHETIDRGHLKETPEACCWVMDYDLLKPTMVTSWFVSAESLAAGRGSGGVKGTNPCPRLSGLAIAYPYRLVLTHTNQMCPAHGSQDAGRRLT